MKTSHIIIIVILIAAIAVIISVVYKSDTYSNFKEAKKNPAREVQIIGTLMKDQPVVFDTLTSARLSFTMKDEQGVTATVVYSGTKPQDFEKLEQVVVEGHWQDSIFNAGSLLLKCPSKYKDSQPEAFGNKKFTP